jgi:hypothetical protein
MPKVILNKKEYTDLDPKFIDSITNNLSNRLMKATNATRIGVDSLAVTSEMSRMYGQAVKQKPWYKDFVLEFCAGRKIPCDIRSL